MFYQRLMVVQVDVEDQEFEEEFLSQEDPSMLHFLLASGEEASPPLNAQHIHRATQLNMFPG